MRFEFTRLSHFPSFQFLDLARKKIEITKVAFIVFPVDLQAVQLLSIFLLQVSIFNHQLFFLVLFGHKLILELFDLFLQVIRVGIFVLLLLVNLRDRGRNFSLRLGNLFLDEFEVDHVLGQIG